MGGVKFLEGPLSCGGLVIAKGNGCVDTGDDVHYLPIRDGFINLLSNGATPVSNATLLCLRGD